MQESADLKPFNTFGVAARARALARVRSVADIQEALSWAEARGLPILIMGGGSNLLFAGDYPGVVVRIEVPGRTLLHSEGDDLLLEVGAGENWHRLVVACLEEGWFGLENLALIPGTVGAAPVQNIGAYGVELDSVCTGVVALERDSGRQVTLDRDACRFAYRDSVFKHSQQDRLIITAVRLGLSRRAHLHTDYPSLREELDRRFPGAEVTPAQVAEAVCAVRRARLPDPAQLPNAGSFFKNPVLSADAFSGLQEQARHRQLQVPWFATTDPAQRKLPAAWLLEQCGWKGRRIGAVGVHDQHPLVIVNHGEGTGAELLALARDMQRSVRDRFGILLEPEVRIIEGAAGDTSLQQDSPEIVGKKL
jgi:UDP-N-acetylmuramate dehydrogenase